MKSIFFLTFLLYILISCKSKTPDLIEPPVLEFNPNPTCEELDYINLNNSILFFEIKGLVDDKDYEKLPDRTLKDAILLKSSTVSAIQKTANFYIIDGKCEEGKLLMQV